MTTIYDRLGIDPTKDQSPTARPVRLANSRQVMKKLFEYSRY